MIGGMHGEFEPRNGWYETVGSTAGLVVHCDLEGLVTPFLGQRHGQRHLDRALIDKELLHKLGDAILLRGRPRRFAHDHTGKGRDLDRERDIPRGNRPPVDVQTRIDGQLDGEPQPLEKPVAGRIEGGMHLETRALGDRLRPTGRTLQTKALLENAHTSFSLAIALLKPFLHNLPMCVEEKYAGIGYAPVAVLLGNAVGCMLLVDVLVQQAKGTNDRTPFIGEESIRDIVRVGKPA
jgi:hypothetical protein